MVPATILLSIFVLCFIITFQRSVRGKNNILLIITIFVTIYLSVVCVTQGGYYWHYMDNDWADSYDVILRLSKMNCYDLNSYNSYFTE